MIIRPCDGCTLCCKVLPADTFGKKAHKWCKYCDPETGCTIHEQRFEECKTFQCLWTWANNSLFEIIKDFKPNKVHFVMTFNFKTQAIEITCDKNYSDAWKNQLKILEELGNMVAVVVFTSSLPIGLGKIASERFGKK